MRNYIDLITEDKQNQKLIENFQTAGKLITEAQLTADQINQIFAGIEKNMTAAGGNRTAVGKGVDTAKSAAGAVGKAYNTLVDKFSNTKIMQGFDAAYDKAAEQLKQATGGDQGAMQYVQKYRDFAKKHPIAQSAIYALLIAAVSIGSGGAAAPAALGLLKMGDRLLQGDKFSQALAKGATTGAAAAVGQGIKGALSGQQVPSSGYSRTSKLVNKFSDFSDTGDLPEPVTTKSGAVIQRSRDIGGLDSYSNVDNTPGYSIDAKDKMSQAMGNGPAQGVTQGFKTAGNPLGLDPNNPPKGITVGKGSSGQLYFMKGSELVGTINPARAGAAASAATFESRAIQAATYNFNWIALPATMMVDYKRSYQPDYLGESTKTSGTVLTQEGINCVFSNLERLHSHLLEYATADEYGQATPQPQKQGIFGKLGAGIKKAAGAVAGSKLGQAVGQGVQAVKTAATNATTQVTADKLNKAWQAAGSPMDTAQLSTFLTKQGVDKSVLAATFKSLNIPLDGGTAPAAGFKKDISQLGNQPAAQPGPGTVPTAEPGVAVQQPAKPQPGQKWQPDWKNKKVQGTTTTTQTFKEAKKFSYKLSIGE